jgi:hypothetical protein
MQQNSFSRCHLGLFCVSRWVLAEIPTGGLTAVVLKLRGSRQMAISDDHRSTINCSSNSHLSANSMFIIHTIVYIHIAMLLPQALGFSPPTPN